ncbi:type II toxin-antitoxin system VapC family toxin [Niveispirillum sp. KHB5.9]|uniref:type II toxin-antitoxin system VapC family toxin n=1 Tax=Niveispirillum sp. KHB5.9 TaxID=3400269 RepID=UPI003A8A9259
MPDKVIDASAIAALLFGEPEGQTIAGLLKGCGLVAPKLLRYEIGNICWKKIRRTPSQRDALEAAFDLFTRLRVDYRPIDAIEVLAMATAKHLTFYDATYVWLAKAHGLELVTLDKPLGLKASSMVTVLPTPTPRRVGTLEGKYTIPDDFDEMGRAEIGAMVYGEDEK